MLCCSLRNSPVGMVCFEGPDFRFTRIHEDQKSTGSGFVGTRRLFDGRASKGSIPIRAKETGVKAQVKCGVKPEFKPWAGGWGLGAGAGWWLGAGAGAGWGLGAGGWGLPQPP